MATLDTHQTGGQSAPPVRSRRGRGFTIIELLVTLLVVALLIGLLAVGFLRLGSSARETALRQEVAALKTAVIQFRTEFGFLPPLVDDATPIDRVAGRINVFDAASADDFDFLRGVTIVDPDTDPDVRFSVHALAYYVMGALDAGIDGVEGEGFRKPRINGTFERTGGTVMDPMFSPRGEEAGIKQLDADLTTGLVVLADRSGTPYRYYRWLNGDADGRIAGADDLNVPAVVGDPAANPELRDAEFAIVSAGPDGLFGDAPTEGLTALEDMYGAGVPVDELHALARADNVVEVGR